MLPVPSDLALSLLLCDLSAICQLAHRLRLVPHLEPCRETGWNGVSLPRSTNRSSHMATAQKPMENIGRTHMPQTPSGTSSTSSPGGTLQAAKDQAKGVMDTATEMATQAKDKVQELASNVATQTSDLASAAADKTREYASAAADTTRELAHVAAETAEDF